MNPTNLNVAAMNIEAESPVTARILREAADTIHAQQRALDAAATREAEARRLIEVSRLLVERYSGTESWWTDGDVWLDEDGGGR